MVIVGGGWVGRKLQKILGCPIIRHQDIGGLLSHSHDWIINCAGMTGYPSVDELEDKKAATFNANALFPLELYEIAEVTGARFAHVSSGCIYYSEVYDEPFAETAPPNFFGSTYSASKAASDQVLSKCALVMRVRMPFCAEDHPKNLLTKLRHYAATSKLLDGLNSLTEIDEACQVMANLIKRGASNGAYNLVNSGYVSTREIAAMLGLKAEWWREHEFREKFPAQRSVCRLRNTKSPMSDVREALKRCIGLEAAA